MIQYSNFEMCFPRSELPCAENYWRRDRRITRP